MSTARRGEFDLLFGAGMTRSRLWVAALIHSWLVPALMVALVFSLSGAANLGVLLARLPAVLLFTGGVAFTAGLVEIRYLAGVLWLLSRLLFVTTPETLRAVTTLSKGDSLPAVPMLLMMIVAAPETLMEVRMPILFLLAGGALGVASIVASYVWFTRADFQGKRS